MKKLNKNQVSIIKQIFNKDSKKKLLAIQGNVSALMELSYAIGESSNYLIVQSNLRQVI